MPITERYQKHREKFIKKSRDRYWSKREEILKKTREARKKNPQKYRERDRLRRLRNPEKFKAKGKRAYLKQREKWLAKRHFKYHNDKGYHTIFSWADININSSIICLSFGWFTGGIWSKVISAKLN